MNISKIKLATKKTAQQAAQAAAKQVREEALETAKSAAKQVGVPIAEEMSQGGGGPQERGQLVAQLAGQVADGQIAPEQIKVEEERRWNQLKDKLNEEIEKARQVRLQKQEEYQKKVAAEMQAAAPKPADEEPKTVFGKVVAGVGGAKNAMQRKLSSIGAEKRGGRSKH